MADAPTTMAYGAFSQAVIDEAAKRGLVVTQIAPDDDEPRYLRATIDHPRSLAKYGLRIRGTVTWTEGMELQRPEVIKLWASTKVEQEAEKINFLYNAGNPPAKA